MKKIAKRIKEYVKERTNLNSKQTKISNRLTEEGYGELAKQAQITRKGSFVQIGKL